MLSGTFVTLEPFLSTNQQAKEISGLCGFDLLKVCLHITSIIMCHYMDTSRLFLCHHWWYIVFINALNLIKYW